MNTPKILLLDIETSPIEAYVWGLWENNVAINQIKKDWFVLSWAAKWLGNKEIIQMDQRDSKDVSNDKTLLTGIWHLLSKANIVVTQNGKKFDIPKLNARFIIHGLKPPSSFQHIDTRRLAKKHFGFTSNSLEYMAEALDLKHKKLKHKKFPGQELWTECLNGNQTAWKEMAKYNKYDVLTLEDLYKTLIPWDNTINFNVYYGDTGAVCTCGSKSFSFNGYSYTKTGKFQRYECKACGSELKARQNLIPKATLKTLKIGTSR